MGNQSYKWVGTRQPRPDGADKVTGRARFGADFDMPGQLVGKVLRSPHAHANIRSIDTSKAKALRGVKAVITAADLPDMPDEMAPAGEVMVNLRDVTRNVMAREKALYDGHAVAAVAATSEAIAREALDLIEVDYEVLPHVIDVDDAVAAGAPILHENLRTEGDEDAADAPTNVAKRIEFLKGDLDAGWAEAEVVVEGTFTTKPVHQGYIEPHAAVASATEDGQVQRGARPRDNSTCAVIAPNCSTCRPRKSASRRRRLAVVLAAKRWSIWSRWRSNCRKWPVSR